MFMELSLKICEALVEYFANYDAPVIQLEPVTVDVVRFASWFMDLPKYLQKRLVTDEAFRRSTLTFEAFCHECVRAEPGDAMSIRAELERLHDTESATMAMQKATQVLEELSNTLRADLSKFKA